MSELSILFLLCQTSRTALKGGRHDGVSVTKRRKCHSRTRTYGLLAWSPNLKIRIPSLATIVHTTLLSLFVRPRTPLVQKGSWRAIANMSLSLFAPFVLCHSGRRTTQLASSAAFKCSLRDRSSSRKTAAATNATKRLKSGHVHAA